jgi:hypothetical protein
MKAEAILAWMLSLQPPGASIYSQVVVEPNSSPACDDAVSLLCQPPKWSEAHGAYTRAETWDEGLPRYWTIAQSIAATGDVAPAVLTVVYHESGFRRDTHSGVGKWARGDQGRSYCLGQRLLGKRNPAGPKLEGIDRAATDRCIAAVVRHLRHVPNERPYAKFARYGGVWAQGDRRVLSRVRTFQRLRSAAPKLAVEVREALGLEP